MKMIFVFTIIFALVQEIFMSACRCNVSQHISGKAFNVYFLGNLEWHFDDCSCDVRLSSTPSNVMFGCPGHYDASSKVIHIQGQAQNGCSVYFEM